MSPAFSAWNSGSRTTFAIMGARRGSGVKEFVNIGLFTTQSCRALAIVRLRYRLFVFGLAGIYCNIGGADTFSLSVNGD